MVEPCSSTGSGDEHAAKGSNRGTNRNIRAERFVVGLAERVGFEPTNTREDVTEFPVQRLRPLGHLSGWKGCEAYTEGPVPATNRLGDRQGNTTPASRMAFSTAARRASLSGVSGRRIPPAINPIRSAAHFTGIGFGSTKSA